MSEPERKTANTLRAQAKQQQQRMRRLRVLLFALGIAGIALVLGWQWLTSSPSRTHQAVTVDIPHGTRSPAIGSLLESKGVIRSAYAFILQARMDGAGNELKAGRYTLTDDMPLEQVVDTLKKGPSQVDEGVHVTIPEGFTLKQIADLMDERGVTDGAELRRLATNAAAIADLQSDFPLPKTTLEGYLFPDTYTFKPRTPPAKVLESLLANFGARFARPYSQEISASGRNLHDVVTIASLIEREARVPLDRARIAGVIDNRIKRKMRLEIDATILYALGVHKSRVLYKDLAVRSPYNTYRHAGLPPGPIANPGLPCLLAALHPEQHDFIYYVARPNGSHIFTRTAREHALAIRQVRAERKQQNNAAPVVEPESGERP